VAPVAAEGAAEARVGVGIEGLRIEPGTTALRVGETSAWVRHRDAPGTSGVGLAARRASGGERAREDRQPVAGHLAQP
jgi:hypothetical protein